MTNKEKYQLSQVMLLQGTEPALAPQEAQPSTVTNPPPQPSSDAKEEKAPPQ